MDNTTETQIKTWCETSGWTDFFFQEGQFYAFPPGAVMPLPVPTAAIESEKKIREIINHKLKKLLLTIVHLITCASS